MRMCVAWYTRLFGFLSESALCAHDIMYVGHYKKSLLGDNDSRCYLRKMKIISLDWIVLLRRLLIRNIILLIRNYETSFFNLLKFPILLIQIFMTFWFSMKMHSNEYKQAKYWFSGSWDSLMNFRWSYPFGFGMINAFKWVQTSLVLVQWFLRLLVLKIYCLRSTFVNYKELVHWLKGILNLPTSSL